ncbi:MAG: hypothetical protein AAFX93_12185 [Verrucomicrobiota bacterium]
MSLNPNSLLTAAAILLVSLLPKAHGLFNNGYLVTASGAEKAVEGTWVEGVTFDFKEFTKAQNTKVAKSQGSKSNALNPTYGSRPSSFGHVPTLVPGSTFQHAERDEFSEYQKAFGK